MGPVLSLCVRPVNAGPTFVPIFSHSQEQDGTVSRRM